MTKEQVIKAGEKIVEGEIPSYFQSIYFFGFIGVVVLLVIALIVYRIMFDLLFMPFAFVTLVALFLSMVFSFTSGDFHEPFMTYNKEVEEWKKEVVEPYIESLPTKERELTTVILDTAKFNGTTYTDQLPLIISYKENGKTVTTSGVYDIEERLEEGENPYLEYRRLNDELGHDVNPGSYNIKIVLPKNFKLEPSSK